MCETLERDFGSLHGPARLRASQAATGSGCQGLTFASSIRWSSCAAARWPRWSSGIFSADSMLRPALVARDLDGERDRGLVSWAQVHDDPPATPSFRNRTPAPTPTSSNAGVTCLRCSAKRLGLPKRWLPSGYRNHLPMWQNTKVATGAWTYSNILMLLRPSASIRAS
jgi:hypothetical protein